MGRILRPPSLDSDIDEVCQALVYYRLAMECLGKATGGLPGLLLKISNTITRVTIMRSRDSWFSERSSVCL